MSVAERLKASIEKRKKAEMLRGKVDSDSPFSPRQLESGVHHQTAIVNVYSSDEIYLISLLKNASFIESLQNFTSKLSLNPNSVKNVMPSLARVNELILFYNQKIETWIRCRILKFNEAATVELFGIDHGYYLSGIPISKCKVFLEDTPEILKSTDGIAHRMAIFGVKDKDFVANDFKKFTLDKRSDILLTAFVSTASSKSGINYGSLELNGCSFLTTVTESLADKLSIPFTLHDVKCQVPFCGTIVFARDPSFIYVHPHAPRDLKLLKHLMTEIGFAISAGNVENLQEREKYETGTYVLAKFLDHNYYRAEVIDHVDSERINLLFLDYGNKSCIRAENVRVLPDNLRRIPRMGFAVKLDSVISRNKSGKYQRDVEIFCYKLSTLYSNVENAFEITLNDNLDDDGIFPAKLKLLKPVEGDEPNADLAESISIVSTGMLKEISSGCEIYKETELEDKINVGKNHKALIYESNSRQNTFSALLHENFDAVLTDLMEIKMKLKCQFLPYKASYKHGDLVLFDVPGEMNPEDLPFNRGMVVEFNESESSVLVKALELPQKFNLHTKEVIPYLKTFKLSPRATYKCVSSEDIQSHDFTDGEYMATVQFENNCIKSIDGSNYKLVRKLTELS